MSLGFACPCACVRLLARARARGCFYPHLVLISFLLWFLVQASDSSAVRPRPSSNGSNLCVRLVGVGLHHGLEEVGRFGNLARKHRTPLRARGDTLLALPTRAQGEQAARASARCQVPGGQAQRRPSRLRASTQLPGAPPFALASFCALKSTKAATHPLPILFLCPPHFPAAAAAASGGPTSAPCSPRHQKRAARAAGSSTWHATRTTMKEEEGGLVDKFATAWGASIRQRMSAGTRH